VNGATQVVAPVYVRPPHWPYSATVPAVEVDDGAGVGVTEEGVGALEDELGATLDEPGATLEGGGAELPSHEKTAGPGMV